MRNLFALTPMALALCTASAAWADEGEAKEGFIEGSSLQLLTRNYSAGTLPGTTARNGRKASSPPFSPATRPAWSASASTPTACSG